MAIIDHPKYQEISKKLNERYSIEYLIQYFEPAPSYNDLYAMYPDARNMESLQKAGQVLEGLLNRNIFTSLPSAVEEFVKTTPLEELQQLPPSLLIDFQQITITGRSRVEYDKLNLALNINDEAEKVLKPRLKAAAGKIAADPELLQQMHQYPTSTEAERIACLQKFADIYADSMGIEKVDIVSGDLPPGARAISFNGKIIVSSNLIMQDNAINLLKICHELIHIDQYDMVNKLLDGNRVLSESEYTLARAYMMHHAADEARIAKYSFEIDYSTRTVEEQAYVLGPQFEKYVINALNSNPAANGIHFIFSASSGRGEDIVSANARAEGYPIIRRENVGRILEAMGAEANRPYTEANFDQTAEYIRQELVRRGNSLSMDFNLIADDSKLPDQKIAVMLKDGNLSQAEIEKLKANLKPEHKEYGTETIDDFAKHFNEGFIAGDNLNFFQELKAFKANIIMQEPLQNAFDQSPSPPKPGTPASSKPKQL